MYIKKHKFHKHINSCLKKQPHGLLENVWINEYLWAGLVFSSFDRNIGFDIWYIFDYYIGKEYQSGFIEFSFFVGHPTFFIHYKHKQVYSDLTGSCNLSVLNNKVELIFVYY